VPATKYLELVQEMENWHSEQFVLMFTGYLLGRLNLKDIKDATLPDMRQAWEEFKVEMGKKAAAAGELTQ
jgi:hypothetical protein